MPDSRVPLTPPQRVHRDQQIEAAVAMLREVKGKWDGEDVRMELEVVSSLHRMSDEHMELVAGLLNYIDQQRELEARNAITPKEQTP